MGRSICVLFFEKYIKTSIKRACLSIFGTSKILFT